MCFLTFNSMVRLKNKQVWRLYGIPIPKVPNTEAFAHDLESASCVLTDVI